ncbi:MAG: hypothetical protein ACRDY2_11285 [Acidimicrobiales bacterium]
MAWRTAMAITSDPVVATQAVTRAFTKIMANEALGPIGSHLADGPASLRPELLAATREVAVTTLRHAGSARAGEHQGRGPDQAARVTAAFRALPERWRSVLWLVEVERIPVPEAARIIGVQPQDISPLTEKAWSGLEELARGEGRPVPAIPTCACAARLVGYFSGTLPVAKADETETHVSTCPSCTERLARLEALGVTLRQVVVPLPEGLLAAATRDWVGAPVEPASPRASVRGPTEAGKPLVRAWLAALGLAIIAVAVLDQSSAPVPPAAPQVAAAFPQSVPTVIGKPASGGQPPSASAKAALGGGTGGPSGASQAASPGPGGARGQANAAQGSQPTSGTPSSGPASSGPVQPKTGAATGSPSPASTDTAGSGAPLLVLPSAAPQVAAVDTSILGVPVALNVGTCTGVQLAFVKLGCTSPTQTPAASP